MTSRPSRVIPFLLPVVVGVLTFGWMCAAVGNRDGTPVLDGSISDWFLHHRSPAEGDAGLALAQVTSPSLVVLVVIVAALVLYSRGLRRYAALLAGSAVVAAVVSVGVKYAEHRPRPLPPVNLAPESESSFPSGHLLVMATVAVVVVGLAWSHLDRLPRLAVVVAATAVCLLVAGDRLLVGAHWFTDVVASLALAAAIGWSALAIDRLASRPTQPRSHRAYR